MKHYVVWAGALCAVATGTWFSAHGTDAQAGANRQQCSAAVRQHNAELGRIVLEEVFGQGRIAENEHIYHLDFVAHTASGDVGRAEDRAATEGWHAAFPDMQVKALRVAAGCDFVAVHFQGTGTNSGTGNGLPATGRRLDVQGATFFRIHAGRVAEEWSVFDRYTMLKQLGLLQK